MIQWFSMRWYIRLHLYDEHANSSLKRQYYYIIKKPRSLIKDPNQDDKQYLTLNFGVSAFLTLALLFCSCERQMFMITSRETLRSLGW